MKTRISLLLICLAGVFLLNSCRDDKDSLVKSEREFMTQFRHFDNMRNDPRLGTGSIDRIENSHVAPPYGCGNLSGLDQNRPNSLYLIWYGIEDCLGYHVRIKSSLTGVGEGVDRWTKEAAIVDTIIYDPHQVTLTVDNLQYAFLHDCAIRVLSKKGTPPSKDVFYTSAYENDPYHSYWYGYGGGQHRPNYCRIYTAARPGVPGGVIQYQGSRDPEGTWVDIDYNLNAKRWVCGGDANLDCKKLNHVILSQIDMSVTPPMFPATYIEVKPQIVGSNAPETKRLYFGKDIIIDPNPEVGKEYMGTVRFEGLQKNVVYIINIINDNPALPYWDRLYNTEMVRMKGGDPLPGELIPHTLYTPKMDEFGMISTNELALQVLSKKFNACRLDEKLVDYMDNNEYPEDQEFLLEPGKTYFLNTTINMYKGFKLRCADPNNRATVLMGIGWNWIGEEIGTDYDPSRALISGTNIGLRQYNFSFGRAAGVGELGSINISDIVFENINFTCHNSFNYDNRSYIPGAGTGCANYFINQAATAMNFSCDKFEVRNCDFSGFIRGLIRTQGGNAQRFKEFTLDNILVYDCGLYGDAGGSYAMIAGAGNNPNACLFANMNIRNSSFIDCPFAHILLEAHNPSSGWPAGDVWNVTLEKCTFLNWNTRNASAYVFYLQYPPQGSRFTIRDNLFIMCGAQGEGVRNYYNSGARIGTHPPNAATDKTWDIANNYSTNVFPGTSSTIFTSYPFTLTSTGGAGMSSGNYNVGGSTALQILLGSPSISPQELMIDPYPLGYLRTQLGHKHNIGGLYYNNTETVKNHPIFVNEIGDPRWSAHLR